MKYISTRGAPAQKEFTDVLLEGLAPDGGLYVPVNFPKIDAGFLNDMQGKPYYDVAFHIIRLFATPSIPESDLQDILKKIYTRNEDRFPKDEVTPLVNLSDGFHILELFHGPTLAFKDVALQLLGELFDYILKKRNEKITIIGATSGDTGSAAIEGVKHCDNARIFILHPHNRTSQVQRRQMTTVLADNVYNIAIEGSFDDCQNIVKKLFGHNDFREKHNLSAVNSINWARIIAQTVYYVYAYLKIGKPLNFAVPTGNFGNVYAAYIARQIGVPINDLVIGSNRNDILTRFFKTGIMTVTDVEPSLSPSMDIQISSNLERYLFDLFDRDSDQLNAFMTDFKKTGTASIDNESLAKAQAIFSAYRCDDDMTLETIRTIESQYNYLCDPHTAVGVSAAIQHRKHRGDSRDSMVALACAHPAKFPDAIEKAVNHRPDLPYRLQDLYDRKERYTVLPADSQRVREFIENA